MVRKLRNLRILEQMLLCVENKLSPEYVRVAIAHEKMLKNAFQKQEQEEMENRIAEKVLSKIETRISDELLEKAVKELDNLFMK